MSWADSRSRDFFFVMSKGRISCSTLFAVIIVVLLFECWLLSLFWLSVLPIDVGLERLSWFICCVYASGVLLPYPFFEGVGLAWEITLPKVADRCYRPRVGAWDGGVCVMGRLCRGLLLVVGWRMEGDERSFLL